MSKVLPELELETFLLAPRWMPREGIAPADDSIGIERWLIACEMQNEKSLATTLPAGRCILLNATGTLAERYTAHALRLGEQLRLIGEGMKGDAHVQLVVPAEGEGEVFQGLHALLASAGREYPGLRVQTVAVEPMQAADLLRCVHDARQRTESCLKYTAGGCESLHWVEHTAGVRQTLWRDHGVYWITGGLGGLGRVFAQAIAREVKEPVLLLTGRSATLQTHLDFADDLRAAGATVELYGLDVADREAVGQWVTSVQQRHGRLDGVIHAAGVLKDQLLRNLDEAALQHVLAPKVTGLEVLDEATRDLPLQWMLLCSSLASVTGNAGQGAYAVANGFLDAFARYRQKRVARKERSGHTLSVNWPLWDGVGMTVDEAVRNYWRKAGGLDAMPIQAGLAALHQAAALGTEQVLVLHGERERLMTVVNGSVAPEYPSSRQSAADDADELGIFARSYLKQVFAEVLKLSVARIDDRVTLDQYGIDSIRAMALTREMESSFGALPPTLFFEYRSIDALADYFLGSHREALLGLREQSADKAPPATRVATLTPRKGNAGSGGRRAHLRAIAGQRNAAAGALDIAIVGLSGRYPQAPDLNAFWSNLSAGKDCISEIPAERWDWREYFDTRKDAEGKSYSKWGGFVDGVDCFDSLFFNISPREAKRLDPQERLFLQSAYHAIEDAGYTRDNLCADRAVGVFAGVMYQDYQLHGSATDIAISSHASVANRVSYFCDFRGPSLTLDTMCSSSLTAIHLACHSLLREECRVALAGGVNLSLHPNKYLMLSQGKFASSNGHCSSFGEGGDGYVPGEGVGVVVLKPLQQAIADGDHIYGVIKGSAVNHGGRTNGYTVPNIAAQSMVVGRALAESNVDARAISYVEAHGTGTALGDPIEIAGLSRAFDPQARDRQYCAIGSVKSNIGHCESAAGIAGLTKVLLQMKHGVLAPSLHSEALNPYIDFSATPFVVQRERSIWQRPVIAGKEYPRIAGLSSFGAGGSNAHLIIEEYRSPAREERVPEGPLLIVLSARDDTRLQAVVEQLAGYLCEHEPDLTDLAYTLQSGREAMNTRLALIVTSRDELLAKLRSLSAGIQTVENSYRGDLNRVRDGGDGNDESTAVMDDWIRAGDLERIAKAWVAGCAVNWPALYVAGKPQRLSLPGYPFAPVRHWVATPQKENAVRGSTAGHPLLQYNTSDFNQQRFTTQLTGDEFFLRDHVVRGKPVVPAVVQLEWARAAVRLSLGESADSMQLCLQQVTWLSPLVVASPTEAAITLYRQDDGAVRYELHSGAGADRQLHCQGRARIATDDSGSRRIDVQSLRASCSRQIQPGDLYERFRCAGLGYGASLRAIQSLQGNDDVVLARLKTTGNDGERGFDWLASLLDGALQSGAVLLADAELALPFSVRQVRAWGTLPDEVWVCVRSVADDPQLHEWDISIADDDGQVLLQLEGCVLRSLPAPSAAETLLAVADWTGKPLLPQRDAVLDEHWLVLCETHMPSLQGSLGTNGLQSLHFTEQGTLAERYTAYVKRLAELGRSFLKNPSLRRGLQLIVPATEEGLVLQGLSSMLSNLKQEIPGLQVQTLVLDEKALTGNAIDLPAELAGGDLLVGYLDGKRQVPAWQVQEAQTTEVLWRNHGVYWITGGLGGLGQIIARDIAGVEAPVIILNGRRQPDPQQQAFIRTLQEGGATVEFHAVDVTDSGALHDLANGILARHGRLDGIVHSAGVLRDQLLSNMSDDDLQAVLAAKVAGLVALDEATRDVPLEWMLLCSSIAALWAGPGQTAYAAANGFLDGYARLREALVAQGERQGRTVSVNWPLWDEGGMRMDESSRLRMKRLLGLDILPSEAGLHAMAQVVNLGVPGVAVVHGERARLLELLHNGVNLSRPAAGLPAQGETEATHDELLVQVEQVVGDMIAEHLQLPSEVLDRHTPFLEFGFDSVTLTSFGNLLYERFTLSLSTTVFFEAPTLAELARYLVREHAVELSRVLTPEREDAPAASAESIEPPSVENSVSARVLPVVPAPARGRHEPIAVIGMSGCFPEAPDIEALWHNLLANRDCIGELPSDRWGAGPKPGLRHAGVISEIDCFDPLFFGISPREAEAMDPQQRLLMQHVYQVIEDAGYSVQSLSGSNTALLVGTGSTGYDRLLNLSDGVRGYHVSGVASAMGPNRMSYWLNWHGPSEPVDTACSSSLVAIHRAVGLLRSGQCEQAVVGGVNTIVSSEMHESFNQAGMLSPGGRCRTFSAQADGYVRSEGVGMLFLKPLAAAERDGDHIYGLIIGSAQNHGGRSASLTAPNPNAQARLIEAAFRDADVSPETVSYIEAHGTGTPLGDPIEIRGLALAFERLAAGRGLTPGYCGLGSVKSNIGHLELAAGVASVIKVLLQLQARQLVATLNHEPLNPDIRLSGSPFRIITGNQPWQPLNGPDGQSLPLRAGVSSFGFGGVNAHVLLEEYQPCELTDRCSSPYFMPVMQSPVSPAARS